MIKVVGYCFFNVCKQTLGNQWNRSGGYSMIIKGKFAYFFIKTYVVDTHYNHLAEAILMSTHNICFYGELTKIILQLSSNTTSVPLLTVSLRPWKSRKGSGSMWSSSDGPECHLSEIINVLLVWLAMFIRKSKVQPLCKLFIWNSSCFKAVIIVFWRCSLFWE